MTNTEKQKLLQIVNTVHKHIPFFRDYWEKFCRMVEDYGEHVEKCRNDPACEYKKGRKALVVEFEAIQKARDEAEGSGKSQDVKKLKRKIDKMVEKINSLPPSQPPEPGSVRYDCENFQYLPNDEPGAFFWLRTGPVNPLLWFGLFGNSGTQPPPTNEEEHLVFNCAKLSVVHDIGGDLSPGDERIFYRKNQYKGKYFRRDDFCWDLWYKMQTPEGLAEVERALDRVLPAIEKNTEKPAETEVTEPFHTSTGTEDHREFLTGIANKVHELVRIPENSKRFGEQLTAFRKLRDDFARELEKAQAAALADPKLQYDYDENDDEAEPPKPPVKGYEVERHHVLDDASKAFWRPKLPFNPDGWLQRFQCKWLDLVHPPAEEPRNREQRLICEHSLLAAIHDEALEIPAVDRLTDFQSDDWVQSLWRGVAHRGHTPQDWDNWPNRMRNINTAYSNVKADLRRAMPETEPRREEAKHSLDFRSVHWFGTDYDFTGQQAAAVKVLWQAWEVGTPDVGDATVLSTCESEGKRLKDVFKNNPAWNKMIVKGGTRGAHRLAEPAKKRKKKQQTAAKRK